MKVTSYQISKKLAEIGFKPDIIFEYCYKKGREDGVWNRAFEVSCWEDEDLDNYFPAYDLEILLEALPAKLTHGKLTSRPQISYNRNDFWKIYYPLSEYEANGGSDESLTDTAARLLILLHEKGLIKFGEKHDR